MMYNIAVCIKQVPAGPASVNKVDGSLIREGRFGHMNIYDYAALETALQIRERMGGEIHLFSMGPKSAEMVMTEALTYGADRGILLCDSKFAGADTLATAYTLACGIRRSGSYNLVLCGLKTTDGDTAQVGGGLAYELGMRYIPYVCGFEAADNAALHVQCRLDGQILNIKTVEPSLWTIDPSIAKVRIPSLSDRLKAKKKEIFIWNAEDIGAEQKRIGKLGSATKVVKMETIKSAKPTGIITQPGPKEAVDMIESRKKAWTG